MNESSERRTPAGVPPKSPLHALNMKPNESPEPVWTL